MSKHTPEQQDRQRTNGGGGLFTFLVGIAAGAAAGYYLSTEEGRRMRTRLGDQANTYGAQAKEAGRERSQRANENLQTAIKQGRGYVNDLSSTVKTRVDDLSATAKTRIDETSATAKSRAQEISGNAKTRAQELTKQAKIKADELSETAKTKANEFSQTAKTKAEQLQASAKTRADQTSGSFQDGVARGRARLNQQKAEIDNLIQDKAGDSTDADAPTGK